MSTISQQKRNNSSSFLGFSCGCKDTKSVSVSSSCAPYISPTKSSPTTTTARQPRSRKPELSSTDTLTLTTASSSSYWENELDDYEDVEVKTGESTMSSPSFSQLLQQLSELERRVSSWGICHPPPTPTDEWRESEIKKMLWSCSSSSSSDEVEVGKRVEDSVAVVKESSDPLKDFRSSMLQMIVEKEIVDCQELRELLLRFLALNSPCHHDVIRQAFAEIWDKLFSSYENTTPNLPNHFLRTRPPWRF